MASGQWSRFCVTDHVTIDQFVGAVLGRLGGLT
jgi:hypothetical protein